MLNEAQVLESARLHHEAERKHRPMKALSQQFPSMTIECGYAVQAEWVKLKQAEGRSIIGRKIGLTSRAMQQAMMIDEPDFGTLMDDMLFENGAVLPAANFIDPRVEVEITFVLKHDLFGDNLSLEDVMAATDYVVPSIELIAARTYRVDPDTGYTRNISDTISDNAANAGMIIGDVKTDPSEVDLRWVGAILYRNGIVEETGLGAGILDHPANGIIWLAKRFAPHGVKLEAGQHIMSGSFTRPILARPGDHFKADFGALGIVELGFE